MVNTQLGFIVKDVTGDRELILSDHLIRKHWRIREAGRILISTLGAIARSPA